MEGSAAIHRGGARVAPVSPPTGAQCSATMIFLFQAEALEPCLSASIPVGLAQANQPVREATRPTPSSQFPFKWITAKPSRIIEQ